MNKNKFETIEARAGNLFETVPWYMLVFRMKNNPIWYGGGNLKKTYREACELVNVHTKYDEYRVIKMELPI